ERNPNGITADTKPVYLHPIAQPASTPNIPQVQSSSVPSPPLPSDRSFTTPGPKGAGRLTAIFRFPRGRGARRPTSTSPAERGPGSSDDDLRSKEGSFPPGFFALWLPPLIRGGSGGSVPVAAVKSAAPNTNPRSKAFDSSPDRRRSITPRRASRR